MSFHPLETQQGLHPLRIGVPRSHGGIGGGCRELIRAIAACAGSSVAEAVKIASQRLLIEVLLRSPNVGLREYRLSSLLDEDIPGSCAALWPLSAPAPAVARDTGRGWRVEGSLPSVCNLEPRWFLLSAPVRFEGALDYSLVLLRGEEDGLHRRDEPLPGLHGIARASLKLDRVFFREDEILADDGPSFVQALTPFSIALRCALLAGACMAVVARRQDEHERASHLSMLDSTLQRAADLLEAGHRRGELLVALHRLQHHVRGYVRRSPTAATPVRSEDRTALTQLSNL